MRAFQEEILVRTERGSALVVALLMVLVLCLIGLASSLTSTFEIRLSGAKRGSTDAFFAADGGVQVVLARVENFDLPGKYVDHKYKPFTDPANINPTHAEVVIEHDVTQKGAPRGSGFGATGALGFEHYVVASTGKDRLEADPSAPTCTVEQKVVRLVPGVE